GQQAEPRLPGLGRPHRLCSVLSDGTPGSDTTHRDGSEGALDLIETRYQVGQRLKHPQFGEGLVVEVHTDRGREMLEVVFEGHLRRLSARRDWEVVAGVGPARTPEGPRLAQPARRWHPGSAALFANWR